MSCELAQAIISGCGLFWGVIVAVLGYKKWEKESRFKRFDIMDSYLRRFNECGLLKASSSLDSNDGISDYIKQNDKSEDIEKDLLFISNLCHLHLKKIISDDEFSLFKDYIIKILVDNGIRNYLTNALSNANLQPLKSRYRILFKFADKEGIMIVNNQSDCNDTYIDNNTDINNLGPISQEDFDRPTMVVKINSKYRAGMTDNEVYEACRGWWRLKIERARNVKLVLAVANGIIQGVYVPNRWINSNNPEEAGRLGFEGECADDIIRNRFINRSVSNLFPRGAQNPIAYFNND